jgi:hypothetical protein
MIEEIVSKELIEKTMWEKLKSFELPNYMKNINETALEKEKSDLPLHKLHDHSSVHDVEEVELMPNSTYTIDGIKYETDDNGKTFKVDGKLRPNDEYKVNSYEYKTDDQGRIIEASGNLKLSGEPRQPLNEKDVGGSDKLKTDDKGHVIADIFGGANKIENLVPMDSNLNRGEYKKIENDCVKAKNAGKDVSMQVDIHYTGESKRPSSFTVTHTIDGETFEKTFINKSYKE